MKYSMSLCIRGWAQEFKEASVAANALWPRTTISAAPADGESRVSDLALHQPLKYSASEVEAIWIIHQQIEEHWL